MLIWRVQRQLQFVLIVLADGVLAWTFTAWSDMREQFGTGVQMFSHAHSPWQFFKQKVFIRPKNSAVTPGLGSLVVVFFKNLFTKFLFKIKHTLRTQTEKLLSYKGLHITGQWLRLSGNCGSKHPCQCQNCLHNVANCEPGPPSNSMWRAHSLGIGLMSSNEQ